MREPKGAPPRCSRSKPPQVGWGGPVPVRDPIRTTGTRPPLLARETHPPCVSRRRRLLQIFIYSPLSKNQPQVFSCLSCPYLFMVPPVLRLKAPTRARPRRRDGQRRLAERAVMAAGVPCVSSRHPSRKVVVKPSMAVLDDARRVGNRHQGACEAPAIRLGHGQVRRVPIPFLRGGQLSGQRAMDPRPPPPRPRRPARR